MAAAMEVEAPPPIDREDANSPSIFKTADDPASDSDSDEFEDCDIVHARQGHGVPFSPVALPFEESPTAIRRAGPSEVRFGPSVPMVAPKPMALASSGRGSPSLQRNAPETTPLIQPAPPVVADDMADADDDDANIVWVKGRPVRMRKADCNRASREGRPAEPSGRSMAVCRELVRLRELELKGSGRTRLTTGEYTRIRATISSGGKGAAVKAPAPENQAKVNHLATLKSRDVETYNTEASFLLCDRTAEQQYDRLAESALRANAGNQAVTKRKTTQGAANQTPYALYYSNPLLLSYSLLPPFTGASTVRPLDRRRHRNASMLRSQWRSPR